MKRFLFKMALSAIILFAYNNIVLAEETEKQLYTAYNIWKYPREKNMYCINFKTAPEMIPVGTPVFSAKVYIDDWDPEWIIKNIQFKLMPDNEKITINFRERWHPGKSIQDYFSMMFTTKKFEERSTKLNKDVIEAIRNGVVIRDMNKTAVIMSYGYPPEHKTPSLASNEWYYWITSRKMKRICFDKEEKTISCKDRQPL